MFLIMFARSNKRELLCFLCVVRRELRDDIWPTCLFFLTFYNIFIEFIQNENLTRPNDMIVTFIYMLKFETSLLNMEYLSIFFRDGSATSAKSGIVIHR